MSIIFHIADRAVWEQGQATGKYRPEMYATEGFIHCSTAEQVIAVANLRFRGQLNLVLLAIETEQVGHEVRYENLEGGLQLFPHIYGELSADAVVRVADFRPGVDGFFEMPE
ncbi:MAG TPA: DUF952 domain-containing protein [Pyrinomonadaceae bacterium]|nr:DUF952 domain-containing protein [Pyrinomonadaceae bacterium]